MKFFERLRGHHYEPSSGEVAKERLRLVLAHDRTSISPALLNPPRVLAVAGSRTRSSLRFRATSPLTPMMFR